MVTADDVRLLEEHERTNAASLTITRSGVTGAFLFVVARPDAIEDENSVNSLKLGDLSWPVEGLSLNLDMIERSLKNTPAGVFRTG